MPADDLLDTFLTSIGVSKDTTDALSDILGKLKPKQKTFKGSDPGYNDTTATGIKDEDTQKVMDRLRRITPERRVEPPNYYDYLEYPHRTGADEFTLRIGDCSLVIPPEFISVRTSSTTDSVVSIRQEGSTKVKHGYSRREIVVQFVFNGYEQINGYEVESPFPKSPYYVDGLRPLLAQFKCTPFLPVVNDFLNTTHAIFNVALSGFSVNTMPGFPDTLQATLVMQEFNVEPYIEVPGIFFEDYIDWDLFRYYYQRAMSSDGKEPNYLKPVGKDQSSLTGSFVFKALNPETLLAGVDDEDYTIGENLLKDKSFTTIVTNEDNVQMTELQFGLSNLLPTIQLADQSTPTMQFMGGMDTTFTFTLETTSAKVIAKFQQLENMTKTLVRTYRKFNSFGFVKVENELISLTGTSYLMIDDINVSTVPEFPDLYQIQIQCISFNARQERQESIQGFSPVNQKGTMADTITQDYDGFERKARQDNEIERQLMKHVELYPDLFLPTYKEVNVAILAIQAFRKNKGLSPLGYTEYPKEVSYIPGKGPGGYYSVYLDPDFYVFYPMKYEDMDPDANSTLHKNVQPTPNSFTVPDKDWGDEIPEGAIAGDDGSLTWSGSSGGSGGSSGGGAIGGSTSANASTQAFIDLAQAQRGKPYVWGAAGPNSFDCSGLICWLWIQLGIAPAGYRTNHQGLVDDAARVQKISESELQPGDLLVSDGHLAIYLGNEDTVEAMNPQKGVTNGKKSWANYYQFGRVRAFASGGTTSATTSTRKATGNLSFDGTESAPRVVETKSKVSADTMNQTLGGVLAGRGSTFISLGQQYGVDPAIVAAIVIHETGNGTSNAIRNYNNPGGIMDWNNNWSTLKRFATFDEGLAFTFSNLKKGYIDQGLVTIEAIGSKYCPVGAANDPTGLNVHWVPNVTAYYAQLTGQAYDGSSLGTPGSSVAASPAVSTYSWSQTDAGKTLGTKTGTLNFDNFGKPVFEKADQFWNKEVFQEEAEGDELLNRMTVDMVEYSARGRLLRAFPTFMFLIVDDGGEWLDGQKLWSNFYTYRSLLDVSVFQENDQPVHTASITVSNAYNEISKAPKIPSPYVSDNISDYWDFYKNVGDHAPDNVNVVAGLPDALVGTALEAVSDTFVVGWYKLTGSLLGGPQVTDNMIALKNMIFDTANVKPGCRIHLRMGYGSNPMSLPISFNGVISDIDAGDIVTIIAQSDGAELVNDVVSTKEDQENGAFKFGSEPSDVIASLLRSRKNKLGNMLSEKWGEPNAFGIEHFGIYSNNGLFADLAKESQYDLCKNLYIGKYKCQPFIGSNGWLIGADGEENINFNIYNKTVWDCMQMVAQGVPEFVAQPMYHQFESRVFYGLPQWIAKYRYDIVDEKLYEAGKTFSQFHYFDSLCDIVDNQIKVSSSEVKTNIVAMYSLGGELKSTPTLYSDKSIDWSKQHTSVIDTTISQDYLGWDWLYEKLGFDVGKAAAIKIGVSNLLDSWSETYQGSLLLLGDASVKPCDTFYMYDAYTGIRGVAEVRKVVHSMSAQGGFVTTITPGLMNMSNAQNSGKGNVIKSMFAWAGIASTNSFTRKLTMGAASAVIHGGGSAFKTINQGVRSGTFAANAVEGATKGVSLSKDFYQAVKSGKVFKDYKGYISTSADYIKSLDLMSHVKTAQTGLKAIKAIRTTEQAADVLKTGLALAGGTVLPGVGAVAGWIAGEVVTNIILEGLFDMFQWNNCVTLFPLDKEGQAFVGGVKGGKNIIPGGTGDAVYNSEAPTDDDAE